MLIAQTPHFQIWRFFAFNNLRNYTYVIVKTATREAVVIDPWEGKPILDWAKTANLHLIGVLNTHSHHDHIRGNEELALHGVEVLTSVPFLQVHLTPGHTMDHVSFELIDGTQRHFFPGDTIFQSGVGNCKNGGEPAVLYRTMNVLKPILHDESYVHPGHDYLAKNLEFASWVDPKNEAVHTKMRQVEGTITHELLASTWAEEKTRNPFVRTSELAVRERLCELVPGLQLDQLNDEQVFIALRKLRDNF